MSSPTQQERARNLARRAIDYKVMRAHQLEPWLKTIDLLSEAEAEMEIENMQTAIEARISGIE